MIEEKSYFVGVRFRGNDKSYYFSTEVSDWKIGDYVVVQTMNGYEIGTISTSIKSLSQYKSSLELKPIVRKPTAEDMKDYEFTLKEAEKALEITQVEVDKLGLPMRLLQADYNLDGSKITITYTADNRVDFRELLKNLASILRCRIELRQIAPRDKAKLIGGIGICGLPLCCANFLTTFDGISITKAKNQMLTLNIPKLSGPCGKLNCCLAFEDDMYTELKKEFPEIGTQVKLPDGDWTITGLNIITKVLKIQNQETVKFIGLDEYKSSKNNNKHNVNKNNIDNMPSPTFKNHNGN